MKEQKKYTILTSVGTQLLSKESAIKEAKKHAKEFPDLAPIYILKVMNVIK